MAWCEEKKTEDAINKISWQKFYIFQKFLCQKLGKIFKLVNKKWI